MIHENIKKALGIDADEKDEFILQNWNERATKYKKPCKILYYCPYGPLVEQFPLLPIVKKQVLAHHEYLKEILASGMFKDGRPIPEKNKKMFQKMVDEFNLEDYPDEIPTVFVEISCLYFGHVCPVFLTAEDVVETDS